MAELYTFSEDGMRKLVEAYRAQQREMSNLKRHLAHYSTRRHEAVYIPGRAWTSALTSGVTDGSYTPSSSTDDHTTGFSSIYTFDDADSFELDGSGYIQVNRTINPCIVSAWVTVTMPFRRNNYTIYTARLEFQNPNTLAWSTGGFGDSHTTTWPDIGTLSSTGGNDYFSLHPYTGIGLTEDWKIRLLLSAEYSGTFSPDVIVASATVDIWYQ